MPQSRSTRKVGPAVLVIAALAASAFAPVAAGEISGHELLRGGLQVSAVPETLETPGAAARNAAQLNARSKSERKPASDPGAELRTQGGLRRDAFRLLLGAD
jgi:hypothetical protein